MKDKNGKEDEPHKIVLFTDGSIMHAQGSTADAEQKAKKEHPNKTIAVVI